MRLWQDRRSEQEQRLEVIRAKLQEAADDPRRITDDELGPPFRRTACRGRDVTDAATRALIFSGAALADLDDMFDFIAADNPRRARTYIEDIRKACRNLCHSRLIGSERGNHHGQRLGPHPEARFKASAFPQLPARVPFPGRPAAHRLGLRPCRRDTLQKGSRFRRDRQIGEGFRRTSNAWRTMMAGRWPGKDRLP